MAMALQRMNGTKTMLTMAKPPIRHRHEDGNRAQHHEDRQPTHHAHADEHAHRLDILCGLGHEVACLLLVEEPEAHALELPAELLPQVVGTPLRQGLGEVSLPERKHPAKQAEQHYRDRQHQEAALETAGEGLVDGVAEYPWYDHRRQGGRHHRRVRAHQVPLVPEGVFHQANHHPHTADSSIC